MSEETTANEATDIENREPSHVSLTGLLGDLIGGMYCDEPCRICGRMIVRSDLPELIFAGYSECNRSRAAHGSCWRDRGQKSEWAFPKDAV